MGSDDSDRRVQRCLRIVQTAVPDRAGGLERVVQGLAIGLHRRGHQVTVAAVVTGQEPGQHPFVEPLVQSGVAVELFQLGQRDYLGQARGMMRLFRSLSPDVVHTHGYRSDLVDASVARLLGIPTVTTVHGNSFLGGRTKLYEWVQFRSFRWFDAVVSVSSELLPQLDAAAVPRDKIVTIPNAWTGGTARLERRAARAALGIAGDEPLIGFVGRLIQVKGADIFLEALARIAHLPFRAVLIGDGREREALEQRCRALGLEGRVVFHGAVNHAARLFSGFDVYALTSRSEGTPIVLFEAMAAGVPVVASRVGGVPDVLAEAGWLVPPEDPAALAPALAQALTDRESARRRAGLASQRLQTLYGSEPWLERHEALYRRLRPAPGPDREPRPGRRRSLTAGE